MSGVKSIPRCPGYSITADGVVFGKRGLPVKPDGARYPRVGLCIDPHDSHKQTKLQVSRLVLETYVGPPPTEKHEAAHLDGDTYNNHISNLAWKTKQENEDDKRIHGTRPQGPRHHAWTLSHAQREELRAKHVRGVRYLDLVAEYGVSITTVGRICRGDRQ